MLVVCLDYHIGSFVYSETVLFSAPMPSADRAGGAGPPKANCASVAAVSAACSEIQPTFWTRWYSHGTATHSQDSAPSDFAKFILQQHLQLGCFPKFVVDLGCGCGRDSLYFAHAGHSVIGVDAFSNPLSTLPNLRFANCDMASLPMLAAGSVFDAFATRNSKKCDVVYMRFSLHSVPDETQSSVFNWASRNLKPGFGLMCIEVRSVSDPLFGKGKNVGPNAFVAASLHSKPHYRRFLELDPLVQHLQCCNFEILFSGESCGWAVFRREDPVVIRVVARRLAI